MVEDVHDSRQSHRKLPLIQKLTDQYFASTAENRFCPVDEEIEGEGRGAE